MKKGFTLVELSIVLVIIGLLVGGILAAQSMISSAKINAQAQQIGQFDASVKSFKTKYNYLPGDAPGFGGDGDNMIERTAASGADGGVNCFGYEIKAFWNNLYPDIFTDTAYASYVAPNPVGDTKNVPLAKMGKNNPYFLATALADPGANYASSIQVDNNYYFIMSGVLGTNPVCFAASTSANSAAKPAELLALDTKIDDGIANTGNVVAGKIILVSSNSGGLNKGGLPGCNSGANYIIANNSYECTPLIRIGTQANDPM